MTTPHTETIATQLAHRTIREFADRPVDPEIMATLFDVAMHTATSRGLQQAGIIWVKDPAVRARLTAIGAQEYVGRAPVYLLFIVDVARNAALVPGQEVVTAKTFQEGFTDACLMAQNVTVAAESLGLGVNHLGNITNDLAGVIAAVQLPRYTFPVLGMTLGWPGQEPQLKPRIPARLRVMTDRYEAPADWSAELVDYDREMTTYYDLRDANRRVDSFTQQVRAKLPADVDPAAELADLLRAQGFLHG